MSAEPARPRRRPDPGVAERLALIGARLDGTAPAVELVGDQPMLPLWPESRKGRRARRS